MSYLKRDGMFYVGVVTIILQWLTTATLPIPHAAVVTVNALAILVLGLVQSLIVLREKGLVAGAAVAKAVMAVLVYAGLPIPEAAQASLMSGVQLIVDAFLRTQTLARVDADHLPRVA